MKRCAVCHKTFDKENPAILTMSMLANPKYLCEECEADFEAATLSKSPDEISLAIEKIGKKMQEANNDDKLILSTVTTIIENATERGELIKNGVYDFANDEPDDEPGEDSIPEELLETEEDRELDEKEEIAKKKIDKIMNYVILAIFIATLGYVAYWVISRFL